MRVNPLRTTRTLVLTKKKLRESPRQAVRNRPRDLNGVGAQRRKHICLAEWKICPSGGRSFQHQEDLHITQRLSRINRTQTRLTRATSLLFLHLASPPRSPSRCCLERMDRPGEVLFTLSWGHQTIRRGISSPGRLYLPQWPQVQFMHTPVRR